MKRRAVLADHERPPRRGIPKRKPVVQKLRSAIQRSPGRDGRLDLIQQRPLLGVAVLAGDGVDGQHQIGVEDDQGMAGQGPGPQRAQLLDPVLGPGQVIAVEDAVR